MNCTEENCKKGEIDTEDTIEVPVGCNAGIILPTIKVFPCKECRRLYSLSEENKPEGLFDRKGRKAFLNDRRIIYK